MKRFTTHEKGTHKRLALYGTVAAIGSAVLAGCGETNDSYNPEKTPPSRATPVVEEWETPEPTEPIIVVDGDFQPTSSDYENTPATKGSEAPMICPPGDEDEDCDNWG